MNLLKGLSKNQKIALWGVIVAAISGIAVPVILSLRSKNVEPSTEVNVGRLEGDGTVIGDDAHVTVDKRRGVDPNLLLDRAIKEAVAKGRAIEQAEQLKEQLAKAVEWGKKIVAEGNRLDAETAIEKLYESGDMSGLQELLIKNRDEHQQALIQRNREIAAVAYLRGEIDIAIEAVNGILEVLPKDLFALNRRGIIHSLQGKLKESERDFKSVLELANEKGNNEDRAVALGNLGNVYYKRGDLDKAEDMHTKSLEINKKLGRLEGMAGDYGNLGLIYRRKGDLARAEEMHLKSLKIKEKLGLQEGIANSYGNLGVVYKTRGELDKAEDMHKKSLEINEKFGWLEGVAGNYGNLGNIYLTRGELDKAEEMNRMALEIDKKIGRLEGTAIRYANLGLIYKQRGDIGKAKGYWEKALELYKKIGMPQMVEKVEGWIEGIEN